MSAKYDSLTNEGDPNLSNLLLSVVGWEVYPYQQMTVANCHPAGWAQYTIFTLSVCSRSKI